MKLKTRNNMFLLHNKQSKSKAFSILSVFCCISISVISMSMQNPHPSLLTLKINNIKAKGKVFVSVCTATEQWPANGYLKFVSPEIKDNDLASFELKNIPSGKVALAVFLDLNGNGILDKNILGAPTEPYAFSNNIRPLFSQPSFNQCSFLLLEKSHEISVDLIN